MLGTQQDMGGFVNNSSCILDQLQGSVDMERKVCQKQVAVVRPQDDKGAEYAPEWPLWREMFKSF